MKKTLDIEVTMTKGVFGNMQRKTVRFQHVISGFQIKGFTGQTLSHVIDTNPEIKKLVKDGWNREKGRIVKETLHEGVSVGSKVVYGVKIGGKVKKKHARVDRIDGDKIYLSSSAVVHKGDLVSSPDKVTMHSDFALEEFIDEKLTESDPIEKWIKDFIESDDPKFNGKSKAKRIEMAKGAYYSAKNEEADIIKRAWSKIRK